MHRFNYIGVAILVACTVLAACSEEDSANGAMEPRCTSDLDCDANASCQGGVCGDVSSTEISIGLRILPPEFRSDLVRQQVTDVPARIGYALPDYSLSQPIQLSGFLAYDDTSTSDPVVADIRLRAVTGIRGLHYATNVRTIGEESVFAVSLPPGQYDVTIIPDRANVPQSTFRREVRARGSSTNCPTDVLCQSEVFVLPAPGRYERLQGALFQRTPQLVPVAGARVFATSDARTFESTSALTDESGNFTLFVHPEASDLTFHVRPTENARIPSAEFVTIEMPDSENRDRIDLWLGDWSRVIDVEGQVRSADGRPVADALVSARMTIEAADEASGGVTTQSGSFTQRIGPESIASDGAFRLQLPPGDYTITAASMDGTRGLAGPLQLSLASPSNLPIADRETDAPRDAPIDPINLTLPSPVSFSAIIVDAKGVPLPGVILVADLVRVNELDIESYGVPAAAFAAATETDHDGRLELPLVPGDYRLTLTSDKTTPRTRDEVWLSVTSDVRDKVIVLRTGGLVSGRVTDANGAPLPGATVEAYLSMDDVPRLIGTAVTDESGTYRLPLPIDPNPQRLAAD